MASAADAEDDYEVIHANSPLYWSMVDAGLEDVGAQDVHNVNKSTSSDTEFKSFVSDEKSRITALSDWCSHQLAALFSLKLLNPGLSRSHHEKVFTTLASSSLLMEEDAVFLHDLSSETHWSVAQTRSVSTRKIYVVFTTTIAFLLLSVFSSWLPPVFSPWVSVISTAVLALLVPVLLVQTAGTLQSRRICMRVKAFHSKVEEVLSGAAKCMEVTAKCVRFIQESELVARGFTFVGSSGTNRVIKELQKTNTQRQCPDLRKKLFLTSRTLFFTFRRSFAQLVNLCPVKVEVAGVMRYCAEIPLCQYPEMLQQDNVGDQQELEMLYDLTDGFSVDVLKSMQELNHIHVSEFIRRLAVCFVQTDEEDDRSSLLTALLHAMSQELGGLHEDLQSHLTAHRHGSSSASLHSHQTRAWKPPSSAGELQQAFTAVHSLELHLLAALKKIQDLSHHMEEKMDAESDVHRSDSSHVPQSGDTIQKPYRETWQQLLSLIRSELTACNGCLEEGVRHLEQKNTSVPSLPVTSAQQSLSTRAVDVKVMKISAEDSPIILDEVFEAYSEPQESDGRHGRSEITSAEEEAWQKKQKTNLKLCLNELQAIIDVRAAERQERERIAMDRMKTAAGQRGTVGEGCGQDTEDSHLSVAGSSALNEGPDGEQCGHNVFDGDTVDDLTKDIEDRVEFWKQFDQMGRADSVDKIRSKSDDGEYHRSSESKERQGEESSPTVHQLSASSSQESDFIFVTSQDRDCTHIEAEEANSQLDMLEQQAASSDIINSTPETGRIKSPADAISLEQRSTTDVEENISELKTSAEKVEFVSGTGESLPESDVEASTPERSVPEGTAEHLSLPAAPSPFAFSIASMVASRARNFAQTEDTFGDSSSEDEEDTAEGPEDSGS